MGRSLEMARSLLLETVQPWPRTTAPGQMLALVRRIILIIVCPLFSRLSETLS